MIKYIGSKRRLVPELGELAERVGARTALDLFTGTTRVAQELKRRGAFTWAVDSARYSHALARCYVEADGREVDRGELRAALAHLDALPGREGYVTETFCRQARYFQPANGARIDAIRDALRDDFAGSPLYPILLTSLLEAADRVDSTTGLQMAYLKEWAPRSHNRLELREPALLDGAGAALRGDALALGPLLPEVDLAYLDPPYNQHSYYRNYHVWETLVAWDAPGHYGVACKRDDCRDPATRSPFNSRPRFREALAAGGAGGARPCARALLQRRGVGLAGRAGRAVRAARPGRRAGVRQRPLRGRADRDPRPVGPARRAGRAPAQRRVPAGERRPWRGRARGRRPGAAPARGVG